MPLPKRQRIVEPGIYKTVCNRYLVDFRPQGRESKPFRKLCASLGEARIAKRSCLNNFTTPLGEKFKNDKRKLSDLCRQWFDIHGHTLNSGKKRLDCLIRVCESLGDTRASSCKPLMFIEYRKARLKKGVTANHLNHELSYLKSVFNELERVGEWDSNKPFDKIKKLPVVKKDLCYLSADEIKKLLKAASESRTENLNLMVRLCLSTGARWGEVNGLSGEQVRNGKVTFVDTKNGLNRTIPIPEDLFNELREISKRGRLFKGDSWGAFKAAVDRAKIELPKGQKTHVLRHTFASHFMMNGGNFLVLNKILGHETIQMTMVYAHLAPDHLEEATRMNPITVIGL